MPADLIPPLVPAYLIGSVPFAVTCPRGGTDLRRIGSGNLAPRIFACPAKAGIVVAALTSPPRGVVLAGDGGERVLAAAAAVVGHVSSVCLASEAARASRRRGFRPHAGCGRAGVRRVVTTVWITRYVSLRIDAGVRRRYRCARSRQFRRS
jgi:hypothetical protein